MKNDNVIQKDNIKTSPRRAKQIRWEKLDNTALLFPVISGDNMTGTFRVSAELNENINEEILQRALDIVLPKFDLFNVRLRAGMYWYYFEENNKPAPKVREENNYPCRFIAANKNRNYMFRVNYYKKRINLEIFHVLTDGTGGLYFLKELVYQYIRLAHPEDFKDVPDGLSAETSMNTEDSFLRNYKKKSKRQYTLKKALQITGMKMPEGRFGVIHGYMDLAAVKDVCKKYNATINEYFVAAYAYAIFKEYSAPGEDKQVRINVPVNLRKFFNSVTSKNFFSMVSAELPAYEENMTFERALAYIKESLASQITKEHLEKVFSYAVANQTHKLGRLIPLFIKNIVLKAAYSPIAHANSTTMTNVGHIQVDEKYEKYIDMMYVILAVSAGQLTKCTLLSYKETLLVTFSSILKETSVQRRFFRQLSDDGIEVTIETNGVY